MISNTDLNHLRFRMSFKQVQLYLLIFWNIQTNQHTQHITTMEFLNLQFPQNLNCQKPSWEEARFSFIVNKRFASKGKIIALFTEHTPNTSTISLLKLTAYSERVYIFGGLNQFLDSLKSSSKYLLLFIT